MRVNLRAAAFDPARLRPDWLKTAWCVLFELKISFILLCLGGEGAWSSSFSLCHGGTEVNHPAGRIQPHLNPAALEILVPASTEGFGAGIILGWLKTE